MTKAVDTVRQQEHRAFLRAGEGAPLTGTKYLWLFSDERRPARHAAAFATLQALHLKVGRGGAIKEALRALWTYRQHAAVTRFFTRWYGWAIRSRLAPVKQVAKRIVLQPSRSDKSATGRVAPASSHAATSNSLLMK